MPAILKGKHVVTNTQAKCNSINDLQAFILCPAYLRKKHLYYVVTQKAPDICASRHNSCIFVDEHSELTRL
jgi:hypothetical protein